MENKRNSGIDLLKIISMFMIVILHVILYGLKFSNLNIFSVKGIFTNLIEGICLCAVNIYAVITGYLIIAKTPKINRIISLWIQVVFYLVISCVLILVFDPKCFSKTILIRTFTPVLTSQYWYFTAYFIMFWCIPLYNWIIHHLTMNQFRKIIFTMLFVFCLAGWVESIIWGGQVFGLNGGYSFIWISILYFIGAGIKLYGTKLFLIEKEISPNTILLIGLSCGVLTFISKVIIIKLTTLVFGHKMIENAFYSYLSPTVLIESICLVIYFSNLKFKDNQILIKISCATFGVYLIHLAPFFQNFCWKYLLKYENAPLLIYFSVIFISSIVIYILCTLIEMIRMKIFDKIGINSLIQKITNRLHSNDIMTIK